MTARVRKSVATALLWSYPGALLLGQQVSRPEGPVYRRPYLPATVPPVNLANSGRLRDLLRGGNLYLTAQDAIALALENNIDVQLARYNPISLEWRLERAEAGGALPGVQSGAAQTASVASGQGVLGSQASAGVNVNANTGANRGGGNATVAQIGPVTQTYDPSFQQSTTFSHRSNPQANTVQSITNNLIQNQRTFTGSYQQGFHTGGSVTVSFNEHYLNENAPTDVLNPSVAPALSISIQQSLLQGRGIKLNTRNITVAKMNVATSDLTFRTQITNTVLGVLNTYTALATDFDSLRAKQTALDTAQQFFEDSRKREELGALAKLDVTIAENQVATSRLALVTAQTAIRQDEVRMKSLISRTGAADPLIADASIIPVDQLAIPATEELPPLKELVEKAFRNRTDLLSARAAIETSEISSLGTENGILPTVQLFATQNNAGLAGTRRTVNGQTANPYFAGGMGTALGQIVRHNFPSENLGVNARISVNNRQAQADSGIDQLQLRQQQLTAERDRNQVQVDILNAIVALRQARSRYEAAIQNRILQQQLLEAEQKKFELGASTSYNVIQQQRDLATAQASELDSVSKYQSARIALDQTTGQTLESNHVSIDEAMAGKVARSSALPENPR